MTGLLDGLGDQAARAGGPDRRAGQGPSDAAMPCHVCGARPRRDCAACDRAACTDHLWTMLGVCTVCARADRMERFHREAEVEGENWLD